MARNEIGGLPFPPLIRIDTGDPITPEALHEVLRARLEGASFCVRSSEGHPNRGGYFFHVRPHEGKPDEYDIFSFEKVYALSLPMPKLAAFVNHCAGLAFDEDMFQLCQTVVNFRLDPDPPAQQGV